MKKLHKYVVMLRRDVQQAACIVVEAESRQEASDVAESIVEADAWLVEKYLGAHKPQIQLQRKSPIRGREAGKGDRRTGNERRATKRRLHDKSKALIATRRKHG